jgi:hypothetical protein
MPNSNAIIASLSSNDRAALLPNLKSVRLESKAVLFSAGDIVGAVSAAVRLPHERRTLSEIPGILPATAARGVGTQQPDISAKRLNAICRKRKSISWIPAISRWRRMRGDRVPNP